MKTTLKDIASVVGVTPQLISFYLNNPETRRVAKNTRKKIDTAVRDLNYQPNKVARALITGKTKTIGLIIGGFTQRKRGCFVHELMNAAKKLGYHLIIAITNYDQEEERNALEYMLSQQVDGILYQLYLDPKSKVYGQLKEQRFPILMHAPQSKEDFNTIGNDPSALKLALKEFISKDHKKICYVGEPNDFQLTYFHKYCEDLNLESYFSFANTPLQLNEELENYGLNAVIFSQNHMAQRYCSGFPESKISIVVPYAIPFEYINDSRIIGVVYHDFMARASVEIEFMIEIICNSDKKASCKLLPSHFLNAERWQELFNNQCQSPEYKEYLF